MGTIAFCAPCVCVNVIVVEDFILFYISCMLSFSAVFCRAVGIVDSHEDYAVYTGLVGTAVTHL